MFQIHMKIINLFCLVFNNVYIQNGDREIVPVD